jgi:acetylornithine deacetylase/succinyl-diaminopimelate desuccinylase-like protein
MNLKGLMATILAVATSIAASHSAAGSLDAAEEARRWRESHEQEIIDQFVKLLSIPNVASDSVNIRRNAEHILELLGPRGFEAQLLEVEGSPPAVFAERRVSGAETTLMLYIHYDGQPVNAPDWASDPWTPVLRSGLVEEGGSQLPLKAPFDPESRIFARSAGDDKAPIVALLGALDAMDASGIPPSVNIKLFMEGEEEAGSPNLQRMLAAHRDLLGADLWLFCDGPVHQSRRWQLAYGVRGSVGFNLTVYGANRPLHSGHYGNWAPNPIVGLMALLGSMRDENGNILIEGYNDEVIAPSLMELEAINAAPSVDETLLRELGIGQAETSDRLEMAIMRPAFNLRGFQSGQVGAASRNAIQVSATASVGLRLVPAQTPAHLQRVIEKHIAAEGWHVVHEPPNADIRKQYDSIVHVDWSEAGYPAYRTPMETPIARRISSIVGELSDGTLIQAPTMGGSLPIYLIDQEIGSPLLILPIANHDNNQHGKNENLRLQNLWDGIEIYAAILTGL